MRHPPVHHPRSIRNVHCGWHLLPHRPPLWRPSVNRPQQRPTVVLLFSYSSVWPARHRRERRETPAWVDVAALALMPRQRTVTHCSSSASLHRPQLVTVRRHDVPSQRPQHHCYTASPSLSLRLRRSSDRSHPQRGRRFKKPRLWWPRMTWETVDRLIIVVSALLGAGGLGWLFTLRKRREGPPGPRDAEEVTLTPRK